MGGEPPVHLCNPIEPSSVFLCRPSRVEKKHLGPSWGQSRSPQLRDPNQPGAEVSCECPTYDHSLFIRVMLVSGSSITMMNKLWLSVQHLQLTQASSRLVLISDSTHALVSPHTELDQPPIRPHDAECHSKGPPGGGPRLEVLCKSFRTNTPTGPYLHHQKSLIDSISSTNTSP